MVSYWLSFNDDQRFSAFQDYYTAETSLCRVQFALRHRAGADTDRLALRDYRLDAIDDVDLYGFYGLEAFEGCPFRWSTLVAAVRQRLEPADYMVSVQLVGARLIDPQCELAMFVDGYRVKELTFDRNTWRLEFCLPATALENPSPPWMIIYTKAWRHADLAGSDDRHLGLPIASLHFRPLPV